MKKIKKAAKIEKVFGAPQAEGDVFDEQKNTEEQNIENEEYDVLAQYDDGESTEEEKSGLTEKQLQKQKVKLCLFFRYFWEFRRRHLQVYVNAEQVCL